MNAVTGPPIVVGVDGSDCSLDAVRLAAAEAVLRRRPLRVVHAFVWPSIHVGNPPGILHPSIPQLREAAERLVADAVEQAVKAAPEVTVTSAVVDGAAVPVLLRESRHAELLVLGDRGLGGFSGLIVGSVAVQTVTHASCPVLVVRGRPRAEGPVVVGVDGSETSAAAVRFAAAEAEARGCELIALHTWTGPVSTGPGDMLPLVYDPSAVAADEQVLLAEAVAAVAGDHPDVPIRQEVVHGPARRILTDRSRHAQLMVVGARGRGGFAGLLLGSVSQHLIHHAECPTAIVRTTIPTA